MQALHYIKPDQLAWQEVPLPRLTSPTDALVRPTVVAACDLDRNIAKGTSPFPGPFIIGHEFCGVVEAVGDEVKCIRAGDQVIASFQPSCGVCQCCGHGHSSVCTEVPNTSMYGIGKAGGDWGGALSDRVRVPFADYNLMLLPDQIDPVSIASGSDNLADGLRAVDTPLANRPGASVLIAGDGSIPLYAVICAQHIGAGQITFASQDAFALSVAESLGVSCQQIAEWPRKLKTHDITFDCTGSKAGLSCVIKSTAPFGVCTSASIYFSDETAVPLRDMYMKGITFQTGRVNSAANLGRVVGLITEGLKPDRIQPAVVPWLDAIPAFREVPTSQKLIIKR